MQIRNQHSRKDYEEQQQSIQKTACDKAPAAAATAPEKKRETLEKKTVRIRPGFEVYKPPHARLTASQ